MSADLSQASRLRAAFGGWPRRSPDPARDPLRCTCQRCEKADRREAWGWYQLQLFPGLPGQKVRELEQ